MTTDYRVLDTAPPSHIYTGGLLCNLQEPGDCLTPDYLYGQQTWDGTHQALNWLHWNGSTWIRTTVSRQSGIAVGMDVADLTGNGRHDIVAADWPLGEETNRSDGHLYWYEQPPDPFGEPWPRHLVAPGWGKAHDLHIGDIAGLGRPDVLSRLKDGRISWYAAADDPHDAWIETLVAETLGGDGSAAVVISESEILNNARLVLLHSSDRGVTWEARILIAASRDLGALHSLRTVDIDGNGLPDIFTAEMELYVEDTGIERRPTWRLLQNRGHLEFAEHIVLDANLGAHMGGAGRITRADRIDFVAKNWQANPDNACNGLNHIVHVTDWTPQTP